MDTANLDRVEILKGPASLLSGEGATGGAINYVNKAPHTGPITNEAFVGFDSFKGYRAGYGSGGSTLIDGLDYRFDISHSNNKSFIDDTYRKAHQCFRPAQLPVTDSFKIWGAVEYKQDKDRFYWGTPLVPANAPGIIPTTGIVSGTWSNYYLNGRTGTPNPVTIDARTLSTTYNVLDNHSGANELWLRSGFQWDITNNIQLKSQVYAYNAQRHWFNNEINSFIDDPASANFGQVYRERLSVDHDQKLYGNVTDLTINTNLGGIDNRFVATVAASSLQFNVVQDDFFNNDIVNLVNPDRGLYGMQQTKNFYTHVDNVSLSFEDRIKLTSNFSLIGGIRVEQIDLSRTAFDVDGNLRSAAGYPFSTTFRPVTGRVGYTWEAVPGLTFYSQYATAADPTVANIFNLRPTTPLLLTTSRIYETGLKVLFIRQEGGVHGLGVRYRTQERLRSRKRHPVQRRRKDCVARFRSRRSREPVRWIETVGQRRHRAVAVCQFRLHRRQRGRSILFRHDAAECAELRRQCRRVLSLRNRVAGRNRRIGAPCRRPLQLSRTISSP